MGAPHGEQVGDAESQVAPCPLFSPGTLWGVSMAWGFEHLRSLEKLRGR